MDFRRAAVHSACGISKQQRQSQWKSLLCLEESCTGGSISEPTWQQPRGRLQHSQTHTELLRSDAAALRSGGSGSAWLTLLRRRRQARAVCSLAMISDFEGCCGYGYSTTCYDVAASPKPPKLPAHEEDAARRRPMSWDKGHSQALLL